MSWLDWPRLAGIAAAAFILGAGTGWTIAQLAERPKADPQGPTP